MTSISWNFLEIEIDMKKRENVPTTTEIREKYLIKQAFGPYKMSIPVSGML